MKKYSLIGTIQGCEDAYYLNIKGEYEINSSHVQEYNNFRDAIEVLYATIKEDFDGEKRPITLFISERITNEAGETLKLNTLDKRILR